MRSILVFLAMICVRNIMAQADSVYLILEASDKSYKGEIQNVNGTFSFGSQTVYKTSSQKGQFLLRLPNDVSLTYKLVHPLYNSVSGEKKINIREPGDTVRLVIEMMPLKNITLNEVVVKAPGIPDTVFMSKRLSVSDFEVQKDGRLVLLTYPKQLKKGSELLLYDGVEVINAFSVPGTAEQLVRDYRGNAHVVCSENVYGLHIDQNTVGISTLDKAYFMKYLAPVLDTNKTKLFFSNFSKDYPAFNYYTYDQLDSTYSKIVHIEDALMMELYRAEYKWVDVRTKLWAKNKELETGVDAEIWVGANYFTQSIYYKELYAPLFYKNDTVFVFDYYKDELFRFDSKGNSIDSIAIYHHYQPKATGWKKELIQDRQTGEIYAVYDRAGYTYLGLVDTKTGEITEKVKLEFRYIDKIAVNDNFVYYVYRPFESTQKKFLYKERLPYEFGKAKVPYGTDTSIETGK
ncbi:MAG: hypothetical protein ACK5EK_07430 [Flavobacteriia bacterium]